MTNVSNRVVDDVVVAAGAWSKELLDPLGVKVPLETERGYHAMLPSPTIEPRYTGAPLSTSRSERSRT
jgi:D-amino-acid dehydrogenase